MNGQINAVLFDTNMFDTNTVLRFLKERNIAATLSNALPEAMRYISVITYIELGATLITQDAHLLGLDFLRFNSISIADLLPGSEPPFGRIITS
jgi:predicted nucleic acid-binding protein